jgi:hypothetical protein
VKSRLARIAVACTLSGFAAIAHGSEGNGLTVDADHLNWSRWQGRISMAAPAGGRSGFVNALPAPGASLSLMSDYYLTGSLLGPKRAGGFRATGGVMIGPRSQGWAGPAPTWQGNGFGIERRFGLSPSLVPADPSTDSSSVPYFGLGYTGLSPSGGWSFSADLGLVSLRPGGAVKLGRVFTGSQGLDVTLRDMHWSPLLQLGVSYSF